MPDGDSALFTHRHNGAGGTDAQHARLALAGLLAGQGNDPLDVRTGVLTGPGSTDLITATSDTAPMTVALRPHNTVTSRGVANGPYLGALPTDVFVDIDAAPASGTRIDIVYELQADSTPGVPDPDTTTERVYGVLTGEPGAGAPDLADIVGAEELGTIAVSAGATRTTDAQVLITNTARQTAPRNTPVPVRDEADRDTLTLFPGLTVFRLDLGVEQLNTNGQSNGWITTTSGMQYAREGFSLNPFGAAFSHLGNVIVKASNYNGPTNSGGLLTVPFASAFPNGVLTVIPIGVTNVTQPAINGRSAITKSGFTLICFGPTGAALANTDVDLTYLAIGW